MTKKDYELIASAIREHLNGRVESPSQAGLIRALSDGFASENLRFDPVRFECACYGEDSVDSAGRKVTYKREG